MDDAYSNKPSSPANKQTTLESLRSENMNYIDSSDVIVEYYKNQTASGLDRYFLEIEEWLEQERSLHDNTPLVLEADDGIGKKTLLVKWMEYHALNKKGRFPDYIIPHFATQSGKNSNYFYAIYRILIKLRESLNIKQKVELLEEKLRRYFHYWLEICSRELEQQYLNGANVIYDKVILIFEGIDNFRDMSDHTRESNVSFWLPKYFPTNIRVIVTAEKSSNSMRILKPSSQIIPIVSDQKIIKQMFNTHFSKQTFPNDAKCKEFQDMFILLSSKVRNQPLFVRTFLSVFVPYPTDGIIQIDEIDYQELYRILNGYTVEDFQKLQSVEELFDFILTTFSNKNIFSTREQFIEVMSCLAITQKGLTYKELQAVCGFEDKQWKMFTVFFKVFLMKHRDLWIIHNEIFKKVLINNFNLYIDKTTNQLHDKIADVIDRYTNNSIRKLEEQTFHLYQANNYFKLKEIISMIENFLLLFNPNNKYDLCRYWQKLEEHGFDPVLEYNKTVEGFYIHYHPSAEDIFRIIIQVSRFLKEFGDFETESTPQFRHPPIIGTLQELYDIGLLSEILKLDLYFNKDPALANLTPQMLKRVSKPIKAQVLSRMESLNVEIAQNREEIRAHYLNIMTKPQETITETDDVEVIKSLDPKAYYEELDKKLMKSLATKRELLSNEEDPEGERKSTDYYYKRWIWIQFPWACLSISKLCDYSTIIKHCFASATDYMSVEEEHAYTNSALKIAMEAKLKKKQMYESNPDESSLMLIPQQSVLNKYPPVQMVSGNTDQTYDSQVFNRSLQLPTIQNNSNGSITSKDQWERSLFITADFLNFDTLQKEPKQIKIEGEKDQQGSKKDAKNRRNKSKSQIQDGESTMLILDKFKEQKSRLKPYQSVSVVGQYQQNEMFPMLKNDITKHTQKQLHILEAQAKEMRRKLDGLVYDNLKMAKELKLQKIMEFNKGYLRKEMSNLENLKEQLHELEVRYGNAQKEMKKSSLSKIRVKTILKICKDNKQQNEEWIRHLGVLINNFKKLIKFEDQDIKKTKQSILTLRKTIDDFLNTYATKKKHQSQLLVQIETSLKQKQLLDQRFEATNDYVKDKALDSVQNLRQKQLNQQNSIEQKKRKLLTEKNQKNIQDRLEQLEKQYEQIKKVFDIKTQYTTQKKFIDFISSMDKKSELEIQLSQQYQFLQELNEKRDKLQEQLVTYQQAYQLNTQTSMQQEHQPTDSSKESVDSNLQSLMDQAKKLEDINIKCSSTQDGLTAKFSVKDIPAVLEAIKHKKELIISKHGKDVYQKIMERKYDMTAVQKQLAQ